MGIGIGSQAAPSGEGLPVRTAALPVVADGPMTTALVPPIPVQTPPSAAICPPNGPVAWVARLSTRIHIGFERLASFGS
jgi:hypothetical protein